MIILKASAFEVPLSFFKQTRHNSNASIRPNRIECAWIGVGVVMLMQPFFLVAYTYSFLITLVGTVMFIIVSHFPE